MTRERKDTLTQWVPLATLVLALIGFALGMSKAQAIAETKIDGLPERVGKLEVTVGQNVTAINSQGAIINDMKQDVREIKQDVRDVRNYLMPSKSDNR